MPDALLPDPFTALAGQFARQQLPAFPQGIGNILGEIPLAQHGMLGGGNPPCSWRDRWGIAERRALKLFKDMYGWKAMVRYLQRGYVDFNAKDGRTYRVYRGNHKLIEVYQRTKQGKKQLYKLCVTDTESIPLTDGVLKRIWMLRCDPNALHEQANVMP